LIAPISAPLALAGGAIVVLSKYQVAKAKAHGIAHDNLPPLPPPNKEYDPDDYLKEHIRYNDALSKSCSTLQMDPIAPPGTSGSPYTPGIRGGKTQ
jgi:hypothetical protein